MIKGLIDRGELYLTDHPHNYEPSPNHNPDPLLVQINSKSSTLSHTTKETKVL